MPEIAHFLFSGWSLVLSIAPRLTASGTSEKVPMSSWNGMRRWMVGPVYLFQGLRNSAPNRSPFENPSLIENWMVLFHRNFMFWKTSRPRPASGGPRRIVLEGQEVFPQKQEAQND